MERELQWWKGQLAADIHQSLRIKELKLPSYRALSPQIGMRRYFADLLAILSNRYQLCPTARHLAVYLLDLFMDHYDVAIKQLYVIALSCLLLASESRYVHPIPPPLHPCKFEEKEDRVPKLEQLNSLGFMCSLNLVLNKKELIKMELLLLETFGWNLCMPTPAHFIDYYLHASVQEGDLYNGWPLSSLSKTQAFMDKYTHYFLEVSLQDHAFLSFRPSQVAAACVAASRICLQISPNWNTALHLLTGYSWDHLTQCIELMLLAHDNDVKEANKSKSTPPHRPASLQPQPQPTHLSPASAVQRPASSSSSTSTPQPLLYQPDGFPHLSQHSPSLSQLQMIADSRALGPVVGVAQDFLQGHRMGMLTGAAPPMTPCGGFPSYPGLAAGLQPGPRALPLQGPISVQMALAAEPRHCLTMAYSGGYLGAHHHTFAAGCFDR
ncbi:Cyclin-J [Merluccius polli]|uniref:Cyclin-J n=1 Tax=Merluccius polli TaxID=89951 RepID=A0AA47MIH9_MERPO|nr:Cyclin-J [Merluccius polli]